MPSKIRENSDARKLPSGNCINCERRDHDNRIRVRHGANSPSGDPGRRIHHSRKAPHVVNGKVMGPYHHYCKVVSPEPVIQCLIFGSTDPDARLEQIEYIIAKSITRDGSVTLADWNKYWRDHKQEIATGRVQVLDVPPDEAKKIAELIATTDGIIFHLWPHDEEVPSGQVVIPLSRARKPDGIRVQG